MDTSGLTPREFAARQQRQQLIAICCIVFCVFLVLVGFIILLIGVSASGGGNNAQICSSFTDLEPDRQTVLATCEQNVLAPGFCEVQPGAINGICTVPIVTNSTIEDPQFIFNACTVPIEGCVDGCTCSGVTGCIRLVQNALDTELGFLCTPANGSAPPTPAPTPVGQLACGAFAPAGIVAQNIVNDCDADNSPLSGIADETGSVCNVPLRVNGASFDTPPTPDAITCETVPVDPGSVCVCNDIPIGQTCKRVATIEGLDDPVFANFPCAVQQSQRSKAFMHRKLKH